ncbi:hypothetical protein Tco_0273746 [Tanacetum coccineum]
MHGLHRAWVALDKLGKVVLEREGFQSRVTTIIKIPFEDFTLCLGPLSTMSEGNIPADADDKCRKSIPELFANETSSFSKSADIAPHMNSCIQRQDKECKNRSQSRVMSENAEAQICSFDMGNDCIICLSWAHVNCPEDVQLTITMFEGTLIARNIDVLTQGVTGSARKVIKEPEVRILMYNGNFDMVFERKKLIYVIEARPDFVETMNIVEKNLDGLGMD